MKLKTLSFDDHGSENLLKFFSVRCHTLLTLVTVTVMQLLRWSLI